MAVHVEARVVARTLPGVEAAPTGLPWLVVRRVGEEWKLEAPLDEEVFPLARWLCDAPVLDELPPGACLSIHSLPSGEVALHVQAPRESVERFLAWIRPDAAQTRVRRLAPAEGEAPTLTPSQEDALRRAAALGYYQIPRSIHLSQLASKLSVSPAALSERLRRAEARLVTHHLERGRPVPGAEDI